MNFSQDLKGKRCAAQFNGHYFDGTIESIGIDEESVLVHFDTPIKYLGQCYLEYRYYDMAFIKIKPIQMLAGKNMQAKKPLPQPDGQKHKYWNVLLHVAPSNLYELRFKNPMIVSLWFNRHEPPIGTAILRHYGNKLYAVHVVSSVPLIGLYPALAILVETIDHTKAKVMELSFCPNPNIDQTIPPVSERHVVDGRLETKVREVLANCDDVNDGELAALLMLFKEEEQRITKQVTDAYIKIKGEQEYDGHDELS